ncbi:hypothetical protein EJB05_37375, partial [Eragrostis curvula]
MLAIHALQRSGLHGDMPQPKESAVREPTNLPISLLESITSNFSDEQKFGEGGFAAVYKGLLQDGTVVAVKKLSNTLEMDEKFVKEAGCLMMVRHKNIVRLLGYCADIQRTISNYEGKMVLAEERQWLLCFEFMPRGSLDGPQPPNILLDEDMVPKIADFGLSRCFDAEQTRTITSKLIGSQGYLAPEFYNGVLTMKTDIYSLGVIIMEILTGQKGYHEIESVLDSWRVRFKTSQGDTRLDHVRVCAEIGIECTDSNPAKRPDIQRIIERLDEMESKCGFTKTDLFTSSATNGIYYI